MVAESRFKGPSKFLTWYRANGIKSSQNEDLGSRHAISRSNKIIKTKKKGRVCGVIKNEKKRRVCGVIKRRKNNKYVEV